MSPLGGPGNYQTVGKEQKEGRVFIWGTHVM